MRIHLRIDTIPTRRKVFHAYLRALEGVPLIGDFQARYTSTAISGSALPPDRKLVWNGYNSSKMNQGSNHRLVGESYDEIMVEDLLK